MPSRNSASFPPLGQNATLNTQTHCESRKHAGVAYVHLMKWLRMTRGARKIELACSEVLVEVGRAQVSQIEEGRLPALPPMRKTPWATSREIVT